MAGIQDTPPSLSLSVEEVEKCNSRRTAMNEKCNKICSLKRGDHLAVPGEKLGGLIRYCHHGIFLGHDKGVADFGTDRASKKDDPKIKDLFEFHDSSNGKLLRFVYPKDTCQTPEAAAHLAEEVVEHPDIWGPYDLQYNNCEHFATRCKVGRAYSLQVEEIKCNPSKVAKDSMKGSFKLCTQLFKSTKGKKKIN